MAIYYPRNVDVLSAPAASGNRNDYRNFYEDSYAPTDNAVSPAIERSYEIRGHPRQAMAEQAWELPEIQDFAQRYGLQGKRVLEIGAGTGQLQ